MGVEFRGNGIEFGVCVVWVWGLRHWPLDSSSAAGMASAI